MQAPRELVFLIGAPGSGKGTNTPYILRSRGLTRAVCVSSLLAAAESTTINSGGLVSDSTVVDALLSSILGTCLRYGYHSLFALADALALSILHLQIQLAAQTLSGL